MNNLKSAKPVRVGVVSDTHIPVAGRTVPVEVLRGLAGVDVILHAGDLVEMAVIEQLNRVAETLAVHGNMDPSEVRRDLPAKRVLTLGGWRIGLTHGSGTPFGLADRVQAAFSREHVDIVVFGHSHVAAEDWKGNVLRFNPGSPTDRRFTDSRSYGILTLGETIESALIPIA